MAPIVAFSTSPDGFLVNTLSRSFACLNSGNLKPSMNRINDNMLAVAKFLQQQDQMSWANSVGLSDHPDHALAGMGQAAAPFNL